MKIYTRTGDDGSTSLFSGERVAKDALRVEAYGTVDELNSHLGLARASAPQALVEEYLVKLQNQLFVVGADLATTAGSMRSRIVRIEERDVLWLEQEIDRMTAELPPLRSFVLPGGTISAANVHVARTICRRAERQVIELSREETLGAILVYLNRLSDFLFTLARYENFLAGVSEEKWSVSQG